nr:hypothetical protein [Tanacetum cinerariifolium]
MVNDRQMLTIEGKVDTSNALDASLIDIERSWIESGKHDTRCRSGNDADANDDNNILSNLNSIMKERWVPTRKIFTSSTTKVDTKPSHGSNTDITNLYKCIQTLDSCAGTSINVQEKPNLDLSEGTTFNLKKERMPECIKENVISGRPRLHGIALIQEISARKSS